MGFLPLVGTAISAISSLVGGNQQANAQKKQAAAAQGQIQNGPNDIEQLIQGVLKQAGVPNFNAQNTSTDPMMQALLNSSGTAAANKSNATYQGIISGQGNPYDLSGLFSSLNAQAANIQNQGIAALNSNAGSFGRRYGSAGQMGVSNLISQNELGLNAQKQQIGQSSFNDAQSRILQAAGGLGQNAGTMNQQMLAALGLSQSGQGQQASYITNLLNLLSNNDTSRLNRNAQLVGAANPTGPNPFTQAVGGVGDTMSLLPMLLSVLGGGGGGVGNMMGNRGLGG